MGMCLCGFAGHEKFSMNGVGQVGNWGACTFGGLSGLHVGVSTRMLCLCLYLCVYEQIVSIA